MSRRNRDSNERYSNEFYKKLLVDKNDKDAIEKLKEYHTHLHATYPDMTRAVNGWLRIAGNLHSRSQEQGTIDITKSTVEEIQQAVDVHINANKTFNQRSDDRHHGR